MTTSSRRREQRRRHQTDQARRRTATLSRSSESEEVTRVPSRSSESEDHDHSDGEEDGTKQIEEGDDDVKQIKKMMEVGSVTVRAWPWRFCHSVCFGSEVLLLCVCVCVCVLGFGRILVVAGPSYSPYCETVSEYRRILVRLH